jgi:hypothetical protein
MSTIRNAIFNWADTPGVEIHEQTELCMSISSPWGSATVTLKDDTYEVESASERLKTKIEEIIERALADEKAMWLRGREWYDWLRGP